MNEENAYILGTDQEELHRLGLQHQVWASEAHKGWELAGFTAGQTILDLGCGPGFCTKELAFVVGNSGKVIGVDRSEHFIKFLDSINAQYGLQIDALHADFNDMVLEPNSLDGMYCRWAMAWIPNVKEVLEKVMTALKPGGKMVLHEYYDWSTHQIEPHNDAVAKAIAACLKSFKEQEGEIDIGRQLPEIFEDLGMKVTSKRLMSKLATPDNLVWQWPKSFYYSYFPRLVDSGYLLGEDVKLALEAFESLSKNKSATLFCPILIEVIAEKK
ncbi:methyltransferase domain-containing protein [uncultured Psychroserpens sp.]|uniref:class I SAM-dependent methyltransferase n=1 Tax=uncultured Psychroserpens sp. TaxID=255436 RepID=UPI00262FFEAD|nr:methyltransferase domain-containing protein [uncultured Psychroserpens sp.]